MLTVITDHLPVLMIHTGEPMTLANAQGLTDAIDRVLEQQKPFAVVMSTDGGDDKQREKGVAGVLTRWLKQHKPEIARLCAGVASVVPTSAMLALYRPMVKVTGPRMYGCPVELFTDVNEALAWTKERLEKTTVQA